MTLSEVHPSPRLHRLKERHLKFTDELNGTDRLVIRQRREMAELFGFETRNKYEINLADGTAIGFAAEQGKGMLGFLFRRYFGHWRRFDLHIFDTEKKLVAIAHHPFRFLFQEMRVHDGKGRDFGRIKQRFAVFTKKFDIEDDNGKTRLTVRSPIWRIWTFIVKNDGEEAGSIRKKWSGGLTEFFTDRDNFLVELSEKLSSRERILMVAAGLFVDLQYFETKA